MRALKYLAIILLCTMATSAYCAESETTLVIKGCCTLRARAFVDKDYHQNDSSRFSLKIARTQKDTYNWDFTLDGDSYHNTNVDDVSPVPYGNHKHTTIRALLHQYDYYDERVTFKNLDVRSLGMTSSGIKGNSEGFPRLLLLKKPVTLTTPSGISVTLLAQGEKDIEKLLMDFNGNIRALFIQIEISPNKHKVVLPQSPLYKEHKKPVRVKVGYPFPHYHYTAWHLADSKYNTFPIDLPNLKTLKHLDSLTLIVRQRVELQSLPVSIKVPITANPYKQTAKKKRKN